MAAFCAQAAVLHVDSCLMAHNFVQRNHDNVSFFLDVFIVLSPWGI